MNRSLLKYLWFGLLCANLGFAPWLGGQWSGVGPAVGRSLAAVAGLAWLADRRRDLRFPRPAFWLWGFIAWSVVTVVGQTSLHASLLALSDLVSYAVLFVLAADASDDDLLRPLALCALFAGCAVAAGIGIAHSVDSGPGWREFGPFATPNLFASYLVTLLPVAFLMAVRSLRKDVSLPGDRRTPANVASVMLGIVAMAVGFTALLLTGSKGAVGALVAAVVVVFAIARPWRQLRGAMVGMAVLVLVFATGIGGRTLLGRVESAGTTEVHSTQFRVLTWKGAARMAAAHPLIGTGIGTFGAAFNRYAIAGWTQAAHNAYLQAAAETGVPGLVLFLVALCSAAAGLLTRARGGSLVAAGALAGLVAAALHNGVDYGWSLWGPSAAMWGLIGLGLGSTGALKSPRWLTAAIGIAMAATLVGGLLVANAAALSEAALDRTSNMTPIQRVVALRSARALDPLDGLLAREMGVALAQTGARQDALGALGEATRLSPFDAVAWRLYGEAQLGQPDEARKAFARGLAVSPHSLKILLDLASLEEQAGNHEAALNDYRTLVSVAEGPVGQYPATPELVDDEPLYAYAALATDADHHQDVATAQRYRRALIALADRYLSNREKYPMIWRATGKDDPRELAAVQSLRARAEAALVGAPSR
ncbi:MAG TPA: O-antigen ligase family protein [Armatimonadota bacterium]|jgi:O-antigen ligase